MPNKIIKNSFNSGELSKYMDGRTDLSKYYNGCSVLCNGTVLPYGGAVKRSGTKFIGQGKTANRLLPFEFSVDDNLIIEMGNLYMRFYKDGDRVCETAINLTMTGEDDPCSILTSAAHGYSDGDWVKIEDVLTATELNDRLYIAQNTANLDSNLIGHWKCNDSAATTNVIDSSTNSNDGTTGGTNTSAMKGDQSKVETALDIAEASANIIDIGDLTDYEFGDGTAEGELPFSICAWAYIVYDEDTDNQVIIAKGNGTVTGEWHLYYDGTNDSIQWILTDTSDSFIQRKSTPITSTGWYHIVATYDATALNSGMHVYLNGSLADGGVSDSGYTGMENAGLNVTIGAFSGGGGIFHNELDDIRIYDVELTGAEAAEIYNGGTGTDDSTGIGDRSFTITDLDASDIDATTYGEGSAGTVKKVYEITTTYLLADLFEIHFVQSADVMYFCHEDYPPKKLTRTSDTNWSLDDIDFSGGPFLPENTDGNLELELQGSTLTGDSGVTRTDSTQSWTTNELTDYTFYNISNNTSENIASNTDTVITLDSDIACDVGDVYLVIKDDYYIPAGMKNLTLTSANSTTAHTPLLGTANDVGSQWQLSYTREDNTTSTPDNSTNATPTGTGMKIKGAFTLTVTDLSTGREAVLWRKQGNGSWQQERSFFAASAYSAEELEDNVYYTWTRNNASVTGKLIAKEAIYNSVVEVTAAVDPSNATVTAMTDVYMDSSLFTAGDSANETSLWSEGAWGIYRGYPRSICFYANRLFYAGTANSPQTLWGSRTGIFDDFTVGSLADDALDLTINDSDVSQIQWMMSDEVLIVGTAKKEYKVSANSIEDPITPTDASSSPQSAHGSLYLQPALLNNSIFFAQGQGRKLRAMRFTDTTLKYESDDATLLSNQMLESPPKQFATQRIPDSIIWVVREDGVMCSFSYEPKEEVAAWARHITGSVQTKNMLDGSTTPDNEFYSVAAIRGSLEDDVWVTVKRTIGTTDYFYIEKMSTRIFDQVDEALMLDSAVVLESGNPSQDIVLASSTVRYDGTPGDPSTATTTLSLYGSSLYGGTS